MKRFYQSIDEALYAGKEFIRDGFKIYVEAMYDEAGEFSGVVLDYYENLSAPVNKDKH